MHEVKRDMQSRRPMDRLLCGDVGYGKTELAIRAAFKAVEAGKQVAVLVPTTVLAEQHLRTFRERMADYPVTIEMLCRFQTKTEQAERRAAVPHGTGRYRHRHAPAHPEGRRAGRPRAARGRRGAAVRRQGQGAPEDDAPDGRRADHDGDADPADAAHVADGDPRHLVADHAAAGSPRGPHRGLPVGRRADPPGHPAGAQPRRPDLLRPQPHPHDPGGGRPRPGPASPRPA